MNKSSSKEVSSTKKTQVGGAPSLSTRAKHLVSMDNKKIGGMRTVQDILLKFPTNKLKNCNMPYKEVCSRISSPCEKQRAANILPRNMSCQHQSKDEDLTRRTTPPFNNRNPSTEPRAIMNGDDFVSLTPLEARMAVAKKIRERRVFRKRERLVQRLTSPTLQKMHKQKEAAVTLLQKGVVFIVEAIQNSSTVAPSSTQLNEFEKENVDLTGKLLAEQIRHETRIYEIKESMSVLESSLTKKYSELYSCTANLHGGKEAYFRLECKNADISQSYEKLLAKFDAYHKAIERSKSVAVVEAYKLGYLDCKSSAVPCHSIEDEDVELFCPNMPPTQGVHINVVDIEAIEEDCN
ncbi:hypothetical protein L3X38_032627 [Prunus dulcis]|uniref:Uncharacterized protein n=1 Tax=Prunus dulcis TaxID=3755 RepID=A0AAD4VEH2_PRUDU|nr:hypothetical protein L3X38_032627 [Prunus dulcis]